MKDNLRKNSPRADNLEGLLTALQNGLGDDLWKELYGPKECDFQRERYCSLLNTALKQGGDAFKENKSYLFSSPGRTELGGNHTDHNHGRVLAAAVSRDILAAAVPARGDTVHLFSLGERHTLRLKDLEPYPGERESPKALIRGVLSSLRRWGYKIGGFSAFLDTLVPAGSGLSSSAAFSLLLGTVISCFFNGGGIPPKELALAAQEAENRFFGKPCGLMDQTMIALGGALAIDLEDPKNPAAKRLNFNPEAWNYTLCLVQTGSSHEDLTSHYSAITEETVRVAGEFGKRVLREISSGDLLERGPALRKKTGDRALLRAFHFLEENRRVGEMERALAEGDIPGFLGLVKESGASSYRWLQNCYPPGEASEQGIPLALYLTESFLQNLPNNPGACRVHGGGFAGTIQAYIPTAVFPSYRQRMERYFGGGCVLPVRIRSRGAGAVFF